MASVICTLSAVPGGRSAPPSGVIAVMSAPFRESKATGHNYESLWVNDELRRGGVQVRSRLSRAGGTFTRDRAKADVAAAEAVRPPDAVDRRIGARLRLRDRPAERADVEHTPAIGDDVAALGLGAGVENLDTFDRCGRVEAFDHRTPGVAAGVTLGRHHYGQRRVGIPAQIEIPQHAVAA